MCLSFLVFFIICYCISGFKLFQKGWLMIPDGFQYFLDGFWNFQNFHKIWTRAPRIYGLYYTKRLQIFIDILFLHIWTSKKCQFWKRRAPKNDEDPSNKIFKILNMGPISTWKHEMILWESLRISTWKHEMMFWEYLKPFWHFENWEFWNLAT